ncbi:MAG: hypothetical protein ABR915_22720 [Thermoguttaceae bacterium]
MVKWGRVAYRYARKYAVPLMKEADRAKFDDLMGRVGPLLEQADDTTRQMLLPALADGQVGLVLDTKLTSKQFLANVPPTDKPLPMIEPALIFGVSDPALLEKAVARYWTIANGLVDAARQWEGSNIPDDFKIPAAVRTEIPHGAMYSYALPKEWGVDPKVQPNAAVAGHVAVLSVSRDHSERLLRATPPVVGGRTLTTDRPLAVAGGIDFAGLLDAVAPWVDFAFERAAGEQSSEQLEPIRQQVKTVLEVLKVFRHVTFESYRDGDVFVTHSRAEMKDVE